MKHQTDVCFHSVCRKEVFISLSAQGVAVISVGLLSSVVFLQAQCSCQVVSKLSEN